MGNTGFVGGALMRQRDFTAGFDLSDIEQIDGQRFDRVVCAGVSAAKWQANADPAADLAGIQRLILHLDRVETDRMVLISTVDVYAEPVGVNEADVVPDTGLHPYGMHRALLEDWVRRRFPVHHVIRLPALFDTGPAEGGLKEGGLKKNALFDLLYDNGFEHIDPLSRLHPLSRLQWYPLERLADDIDRVQAAGLPLVNLVTEPLGMDEIQRRFFPAGTLGSQSAPVAYDVRTRFGVVFGGGPSYALDASTVMAGMDRLVADAISFLRRTDH